MYIFDTPHNNMFLNSVIVPKLNALHVGIHRCEETSSRSNGQIMECPWLIKREIE